MAVYIDGSYAAEIRMIKKFTMRPGNHQIELRDSDGQTVYQQQVAVTIGKNDQAASFVNELALVTFLTSCAQLVARGRSEFRNRRGELALNMWRAFGGELFFGWSDV